MPPRNVDTIPGKIANQRGRTSEQRVLEACQLPGRPGWMKSARAATRAEDHDGIDVVVESDVGKLFVQVKSSRRGKADFEEKRRRARVAIVVVGAGDTAEKLLRKVVGQLAEVPAAQARDGLLSVPSRLDDGARQERRHDGVTHAAFAVPRRAVQGHVHDEAGGRDDEGRIGHPADRRAIGTSTRTIFSGAALTTSMAGIICTAVPCGLGTTSHRPSTHGLSSEAKRIILGAAAMRLFVA